MNGLNIRELAVYSQSSSGSRTILWRQQGELGNNWHFGSVPLHVPKDSTIKVVFEGVAGTGYMGDIAIDDVLVFQKGDCAIKPSSAQPHPPNPTPVPTPPSK